MNTNAAPHPFVGMWVTADGHIRQELLPNGRYDEARGNRRRACTGSYTVTGDHIDYVDDTGFTATGDVRDGVLFHEHLVLYPECWGTPATSPPCSSTDSRASGPARCST
ncbi:Atu4866 domain-containing protein [Streptomyces sp. AD2-2]|nr:Atu4866 domain-containing protein [Streptomyces sp. AD2-2]